MGGPASHWLPWHGLVRRYGAVPSREGSVFWPVGMGCHPFVAGLQYIAYGLGAGLREQAVTSLPAAKAALWTT